MGVRGLLAFLRDTTGGATSVRFSVPEGESLKPSLIVDGNALVHQVSRTCADSVQRLSQASSAFVSQLALVFTVTVLFDGPLPQWKYQQRIEREREKIAKMDRDYYDSILSPLSLIACIQSLSAVSANGATFTVLVAEGEADLAITELARSQDAYISSSDSDFYIHTCRGYFPLEGLSIGLDGSVSASLWTFEIAAKQLGIHTEMLPVLAYVAGCDYTVDEKQWQIVHTRNSAGASAGPRRIRAFANHLKPYTKLIDGINSLLPKSSSPKPEDEGSNDALITEVMAIADLFTGRYGVSKTCPISKFPPLPCTSLFPYSPTIAAAVKSHKFVEILNGAFWCQSIVEDLSRSPAWEISRPIRRKMYSVLGMQSVGEYIRRGLEFRVEHVSSLPVETAATTTATTASSTFENVLEVYKSVLEFPPNAPSVKPEFLPVVAAIRYLAEQWKDTQFQLKNFEVVALLCMAIQATSQSKASSLSSSTTPPTPPPATTSTTRSKQTSHLLASLETILFSAWLLHQSLTPTDTTNTSAELDFQYSHWRILDISLFCTCLMQAKTGHGPQFLLTPDEIDDFKVLSRVCMDAGNILEVVEYGDLDVRVSTSSVVKKKKKRDGSSGGGGGKGVKKTRGKASTPVIDGQNFFALLGNE
ncbi:UNVERIFIED_CONTAM: hypothetical protein HDU68_009596 [Siphonaria sp. JEL0065]|nr:hypothetical protein HDU68_009596 [Siphonaria sp. JEL0065]